jgi:hypothetical protein
VRFIFPKEEYEQKAIAFIQEFRDYASAINGTGGLDRYLETSTYHVKGKRNDIQRNIK